MKTIRIYRLPNISQKVRNRIREGQMEAAKAWTVCRDLHLKARQERTRWPDRDVLQKAVNGRFALYSSSAQMVAHAFLANVATTKENRKQGRTNLRYPYKDKAFYPLLFPAKAMSVHANHIVLPMGRGRKSLVLPRPKNFPDGKVACKLVYDRADGYELHATTDVEEATDPLGKNRATIDLGQIHQAAVTTDSGTNEALIISGRGIRSEKRGRERVHGKLRRKMSRCKKGSKRHRKLRHAMNKHSARSKRRIRDLRHKGTKAVVDFLVMQEVGTVYVGNPHGVRKKNCGKKHNQRMSGWEYGKDIAYLKQKCKRTAIECFTGTERGTSSMCPDCGHKQRPKGRNWKCRACGFTGHRDLVGSANMHSLAFGEKLPMFPKVANTTYLRPGTGNLYGVRQAAGVECPAVGSSSSPDAGHGSRLRQSRVAALRHESESTQKVSCTDGIPAGIGAASRATGSETHAL